MSYGQNIPGSTDKTQLYFWDEVAKVHKPAIDSMHGTLNMSSMQKRWKDSFAGSSLDLTKWDIISQGAGQTITVSNNLLTIASGTTINAETIIQTKEVFTDPVRAMVALLISQKIINQEFAIEFVAVNKDTLAYDTNAGVAWNISGDDSLTTTNAVYEVWNTATKLRSAASAIGNAQTSFGMYELELFADEVYFHSRAIDSTNARSNSYVRHQQLPDPNSYYKLRIRLKNKATAPASSTNFQLQFVNILDYSELTAEITAGRGNVSAGQSMGVQVLNAPSVTANITANSIIGATSTTNLGASATYTATTLDGGSTSVLPYNRYRVILAHTAGLTPAHLTFEQSTDNTNWKETHRIPIPSDGFHRTFDFPVLARYVRAKVINGATAQTLFFFNAAYIRTDGPFDNDKSLAFIHSITAQAISATLNGTTLDLGANHSIVRHRATAYADQAGTLNLQESRDNVNWRTVATVAVNANTLTPLEAPIVARYVRVQYVNGAVANTVFELQSVLTRG